MSSCRLTATLGYDRDYMGRNLQIRSLGAAQLSQAFPLVQAAVPGATLAGWLDYGRALEEHSVREPGGVASAVDDKGYIYGLFCYRIAPDLHYRRVLCVDNLVVLDFIDRQGTMTALINAIDDLARRRKCGATHVSLPQKLAGLEENGSALLAPFWRAGHVMHGIRLAKPINLGA